MPKKIALVGHCGPDATYLRLTVARAVKDAQIVMVDDQHDLNQLLEGGVDLLMFNRQLEYGFETDEGVEMIRRLKAANSAVKVMLVSNYPEAQQAATAAGAVPGFGKREIGSPHVSDLIRSALSD
jgi:two-component system, chemotaxis family, chemotaxis protein CheY